MGAPRKEIRALGERLKGLSNAELEGVLKAYVTMAGLIDTFDDNGTWDSVLDEEADPSDALAFAKAFGTLRKIFGSTDDPQARRREFWLRAGSVGLVRDPTVSIDDASPSPDVLKRLIELVTTPIAVECAWLVTHDALLEYEIRELDVDEALLDWLTPEWHFVKLAKRGLFVGETEVAVWWTARAVYVDDDGAITEGEQPVLNWKPKLWWRKSSIVEEVIGELGLEEPEIAPIDIETVKAERQMVESDPKGPFR